jgi:hypothetical protein
LTGEDPGFRDVEQAAQRLADRLEDRNALLVIDDVWNEAHLAPFLRGGTGCARLITTRQRTIAVRARCQAVTVDEMTADEAILMLTARLDAVPPAREPFRALVERLGEWPLMIDLIGSALQERVALGDSVAGALAYVHWGLDEEGVSAFRRDDADERHQSMPAPWRSASSCSLPRSAGITWSWRSSPRTSTCRCRRWGASGD